MPFGLKKSSKSIFEDILLISYLKFFCDVLILLLYLFLRPTITLQCNVACTLWNVLCIIIIPLLNHQVVQEWPSFRFQNNNKQP